MTRKLMTIFAIAGILLWSCTEDVVLQSEEAFRQTVVSQDFTIPLEDALVELDAALAVIDGQRGNTKSGRSASSITDVSVVYTGDFSHVNNRPGMMMAATNKPLRDSLLYVVDFAHNRGSAILAADSRIGASVLAITDAGSLTDELFPLYWNGETYDDENLQNFQLYNKEEDDYYVADPLPSVAISHCYQYAERCVGVNPTELPINDDHIDSDGSTNVIKQTGPWELNFKIPPKLTTVWHQRSPFNDQSPKKKDDKRAPAGCVPIALAQIIAYHEFPITLMCYDYSIDWKGIKNICNINGINNPGTAYDRLAVGYFIKSLGKECKVLYTSEWAFALPKNAAKCLENLGYTNVKHIKKYKGDVVVQNLSQDNPVFVAAISDIVNGHAWVIDGYLGEIRTITTYTNGCETHKDTEIRHLMHCNFGWHGKCNGYYVSKIFDVGEGPVYIEDYERKSKLDGEYNFNWSYRMIVYNNPNKG